MTNENVSTSAQPAFEFIRGQGQTHRGVRRAENQDSVLVIESADLRLYAVADGMGGTQGGARASQLAISTLEECVRHTTHWNESTLSRAFRTVHERIRDEALRNPEFAKMGTTLVCLAVHGESLYLANVGDSRAYLIRDGAISRLTRDHTVVEDLVSSGAMNAEQAKSTPISHMLTKSLGSDELVDVDTWIALTGPAEGDKFLLCSDGLYNQVAEPEIERICSQQSTSEAVQNLVQQANQTGGLDNVSVVLIDVAGGYPNRRSPGEALALRKIETLSATFENFEPLEPAEDFVTQETAATAPNPARISIGPAQGLFVLCVAFLSGLFFGSEALMMTSDVDVPAAALREDQDGSRASFRAPLRAASLSAPKTLADRARDLAQRRPELKESLERFESAYAQYVSHAEELLTNPPSAEREKEVIEFLNKYERAAAQLDTDLSVAMQNGANRGSPSIK